MRNLLLIILMIAISLPAFAAKRKKAKKKATKGSDIVSVTMRRTACFGRCPTYSLELNKSGMVTYRAIMFNGGDSGIYTKNIGAAKTAEIMNMVKKYRLDTCSESYNNRIPDIPGIMYTIKYSNSSKVKTIYNAHFGPTFLKEIANLMDQEAKKSEENTGWKKVADNPEAELK